MYSFGFFSDVSFDLGFGPDLVRLRALRAPPPQCGARRPPAGRDAGGALFQALSVAIQLAVASTRLGRPWPAAPQRVLDLATNEGASRLPLRP